MKTIIIYDVIGIEQLSELELQKKKAVEAQDFDEATRLKVQISELRKSIGLLFTIVE